MADPKTSIRGLTVVQLIAGMALFGSATPLSKIIGETFPVFTASLMRMVIASIVLAPAVFIWGGRLQNVRREDLKVIIAIALFGMVGFTATMLFGMRMTTGVIGSTIMSSTPAVTALAAVLFMGAAMNRRKAAALALAVTGVLVINVFRGGDSGDTVLLGALLVIVAVCLEAAYTLLSRKLSKGMSSPEATLAASLAAAPVFIVLAFVFDPKPFDFSGGDIQSWSALIFWSAATGGLAPVLWYNGVRAAAPALSAGCMSVMPLTSLLLSYWFLGESFRWVHLAGFGLVFVGLVLMIREHTAGH